MIYKKDAAFSYPILSNTINSYEDNTFFFDVTDLNDDNVNYTFKFDYHIESNFIKTLLRNNQAVLVIIIQSIDNFFKKIHLNTNEILVPKNRLSLSDKTILQLHIQSNESISFAKCNELNEFYNDFKNEIVIKPNTLIGYSNTVKFQGSDNKPLELLERRIVPGQNSAFKVELGPSTIILSFKDEKYQMNNILKSNVSNMYIYEGLSRALFQFVKDNINDQEYVDIESLQEEQDNELNQKLLDLMNNKGIKEISYDDIDEVISKISNNIIDKFVRSIEEMTNNGD